ncbi:MAG: hypothetical protein RBG13Loki_1590 [Promethearchaeota archaeon CR_4]|nr:MAG: hypothetical protein RBG13Loki_1590 [Candidatus Lokiarchaeota archaeon CR_4]
MLFRWEVCNSLGIKTSCPGWFFLFPFSTHLVNDGGRVLEGSVVNYRVCAIYSRFFGSAPEYDAVVRLTPGKIHTSGHRNASGLEGRILSQRELSLVPEFIVPQIFLFGNRIKTPDLAVIFPIRHFFDHPI